MGDVADHFEYGLNASAIEYDGKNKYLRITDIDDSSRKFIQNKLTSPNINVEEASNYILTVGDILFVRTGASVGKTYRYDIKDGKVYFAGFLIRARIKDSFDSEFVYWTTLTDRYNTFIKIMSQRSGQPGINAKEYSSFNILIPNIKEQQKIGAFLKKIDDTIALHQRKLDQLKELKKAYLQVMFPVKDERAPKLRFADFEGEWEQCKLEDYATYRRGSFPQPYGNKKWYDGENAMPFVQVIDVTEQLSLVKDTKQKISKLAQSKSVFVSAGKVVVTLQGSIGRVAITQYNSYIDRTLLVFESYEKETDEYFWAYTIQQKFEIEKRKAPGGTIKTITKEALSSFEVNFPEYEEQQKNGNFLKNLDNILTLDQKKLDQLKSLKKSYLQNMFI